MSSVICFSATGLADMAKNKNLNFFSERLLNFDCFTIFNQSTWKCNYNMIKAA